MNDIHDDSQVRAALAELREVANEPRWAAMEARLLDAFEHRSPLASSGPTSRTWWGGMAAAAALVLAAAITYLPASRYGIAPRDSAPAPAPPSPRSEPATPSTPPAANEPTQMTTPGAPAGAKGSRRMKPTAALQPTPPAQQAATTYTEFVALPAAFALPELESGRLVRMEVPVALLPAYGLDVIPEAAAAAVQAEFLIGQDGVARAIRLASSSPPDQRP